MLLNNNNGSLTPIVTELQEPGIGDYGFVTFPYLDSVLESGWMELTPTVKEFLDKEKGIFWPEQTFNSFLVEYLRTRVWDLGYQFRLAACSQDYLSFGQTNLEEFLARANNPIHNIISTGGWLNIGFQLAATENGWPRGYWEHEDLEESIREELTSLVKVTNWMDRLEIEVKDNMATHIYFK